MELLKSRPLLVPIVLALAVIGICVLLYFFANYREEQVVRRCLEAMQAGDLKQAYELWGPTPLYTYEDFVEDWGEGGYYGRVKTFEILHSKMHGSGVVVTVQINNLRKPVALWVEKKRQNRTIGFSPVDVYQP